jgi:hypothetical protein
MSKMKSNDRMPPNDDEDDETEHEDQPPPDYSYYVIPSNSKPSKDPLFGLRLILQPLPSGLCAAILWLIGAAIAVIWNTFHPAQYSADRVGGLSLFFVIFFIGLGFLIYAIKGDPLPGRTSNPWFAAILSLGLSLFGLYIFIVAK